MTECISIMGETFCLGQPSDLALGLAGFGILTLIVGRWLGEFGGGS